MVSKRWSAIEAEGHRFFRSKGEGELAPLHRGRASSARNDQGVMAIPRELWTKPEPTPATNLSEILST